MRKHLSRAHRSTIKINTQNKHSWPYACIYWGQSSIPQNDLSNANKRNQITQILIALCSDETASSQHKNIHSSRTNTLIVCILGGCIWTNYIFSHLLQAIGANKQWDVFSCTLEAIKREPKIWRSRRGKTAGRRADITSLTGSLHGRPASPNYSFSPERAAEKHSPPIKESCWSWNVTYLLFSSGAGELLN